MKVFLHYDTPSDSNLHKTLKMTLPKKWLPGPCSKLLDSFIETYNNGGVEESNRLQVEESHLELESGISLGLNDVIESSINDRADVYIRPGKSEIGGAKESPKTEAPVPPKAPEEEKLVTCKHFGCNNRFKKGCPPNKCVYHVSPPVFHETAKWWACCPQKKAYDWETFQAIPGCKTGSCTEVKEEGKQFMGGCDLRAKSDGPKLQSIDDFNKGEVEGSGAPTLEKLRNLLKEIGDVDFELFDQVLGGIAKDLGLDPEDKDSKEPMAQELGKKLKAAMKQIAVEQLRIK